MFPTPILNNRQEPSAVLFKNISKLFEAAKAQSKRRANLDLLVFIRIAKFKQQSKELLDQTRRAPLHNERIRITDGARRGRTLH
jgi:hypothetical protein